MKQFAFYSGLLTLLPDIQCDLVLAVKGNSNTYGNFWLWNIRPTDLELEAVYAQLYTVIGGCNFYLDRIDEVMANETSDTNLETLEQYTGEVYAIRALCYSELIKCFCKAYDPATAAQEQGVVLRTKYFEAEPVRRASLYDSYKFVVEDLIRAEERLDDEEDAQSNYYMSEAAVQAIRARVALYMQDWETAITYSSKLIDDKQDTFQLASYQETAPDGAPMFDYMWAYDMSPEVIWRIGFTSTSTAVRSARCSSTSTATIPTSTPTTSRRSGYSTPMRTTTCARPPILPTRRAASRSATRAAWTTPCSSNTTVTAASSSR